MVEVNVILVLSAQLVPSSGLMSVKNIFYQYCMQEIGGKWTQHYILGGLVGRIQTIEAILPPLYYSCLERNISSAEVFSMGFDEIKFRRNLWGDTLGLWNSTKICVMM